MCFRVPDHLRVAVPSKATSVSATEIIDLEDPPVFEFRKPRTPRVVAALHADVPASEGNSCLKSCAAVAAGAAAMRRQVQMNAAVLSAVALEPDSSSITSSDTEDLAAKAVAVADAAERTEIYARSVTAKHKINAAPPAPPEKSDSAAQFKPPCISVADKSHRRPSIAAGLPKLARTEDRGDNEVADELLSRAAACKVPVTGLAGRFMVPAEISRRW